MRGFECHHVAPDGFADKDWFEPMRNGVQWFYHRPRSGRSRVTPEVLDATLDAVLRPVVFAARRLGLGTLPSCAGHTVDPFYAARLYRQLKQDSADVRGLGLPLVNVETGEEVIWRDPYYRVPWDSLEDLEADLLSHEREGAIGFTGPRHVLGYVARRLLTVPHVSLSEDDGALWVWVHAPTQRWQNYTWRVVAERLDV